MSFASDIVEIGSGCGRRTHIMRDYSFHGDKYTGSYLGIDVDNELLEWCRDNFDSERFRFVQSTHTTRAYVNDREVVGRYEVPVPSSSVDLVFATSVLTHVLEDQLTNYFEESRRILRTGGHMVMTCKCLDLAAENRGNIYALRIGNAFVENAEVPELAVAYSREFLLGAAQTAGFTDVAIHHSPSDVQQTLIAR